MNFDIKTSLVESRDDGSGDLDFHDYIYVLR